MSTILDDVTTMVTAMSPDDLKSLVLSLAQKDEHVQAALYKVWKEQDREIRLQRSMNWHPDDWAEASEHYEPMVDEKLNECAALFIDRYEFGDYSDEGRWDYTSGLDRLNGWFNELLDVAADGAWIDASVGLLLTLDALDDWALENGDEDLGSEELQESCASYWSYIDTLTEAIRNSAASDANKDAFFLQLMDWITEWADSEDWEKWAEPLRSCLVSPAHFDRLREHITRFAPELVSHGPDETPIKIPLWQWWVQANLDADHETEALEVEARLPKFNIQTSAAFARYYERHNRPDDAIFRVKSIIAFLEETHQGFSSYNFSYGANTYFSWMLKLLVQTERHRETGIWYVKWFEALPSLELFKICLDRQSPDERASQVQKWMSMLRARQGHNALIIEMYLHLGDADGAWQAYTESVHARPYYWLSSAERQLFDAMKLHDPGRLIPILQQFVEKGISEKKRSSYQRAVQWLVELKSVYGLVNESEEWTQYLWKIRDHHRRLPALQDEMNHAKL